MNKRRIRNYYRQFHIIPAWYFLVASLLCLMIGVYGLRQNNLKMVELRKAVITADESNGDVETALNNLREYVYAHMNTDLSGGNNAIKPPIQLKGRYDRLLSEENIRVKAQNDQVQKRAEAICTAQFPASGYNSPRVSCVQNYVATNAVKTGEVPADLYKFDFVSPRWSPDLAGFGLFFSVGFFVLFVLRFSVERWFIARIN